MKIKTNVGDIGCLGCLGILAVCIVVFTIMMLFYAFILRIGWNYIVVDSLKLTATYMTWKVAFVSAFVLSVISGMFRSTST